LLGRNAFTGASSIEEVESALVRKKPSMSGLAKPQAERLSSLLDESPERRPTALDAQAGGSESGSGALLASAPTADLRPRRTENCDRPCIARIFPARTAWTQGAVTATARKARVWFEHDRNLHGPRRASARRDRPGCDGVARSGIEVADRNLLEVVICVDPVGDSLVRDRHCGGEDHRKSGVGGAVNRFLLLRAFPRSSEEVSRTSGW
jgi:hypothetical protein